MKTDRFKELGLDTVHHSTEKIYVKEVHLASGDPFEQHNHAHDHVSVLAYGEVDVTIGGETRRLSGTQVIEVLAGAPHRVVAVRQSLWLCIHDPRDFNI